MANKVNFTINLKVNSNRNVKSQHILEERQTNPWSIKQLLLNLQQFYKE